jgi:hypothetical protein
MRLEDRVRALHEAATRAGLPPVPSILQGVTRARVRAALSLFSRASDDMVDVVFALLDDVHPSWFSTARPGARFCDGASTAHLACHVGILQRGATKLDREGRDHWIKPLRESGAVEAVFLRPGVGDFIAGHPVPKSSNCAYALSASFAALLPLPEDVFAERMARWLDASEVRARLAFHEAQAARARALVDTKHEDLIALCRTVFAPRFLPGFEVVYTDTGDGDRIDDDDAAALAAAGIHLGLGDAMPDVLLHHPGQDALWVVEAVVSDGEVDFHKVQSLQALAARCGKRSVGFTTAYRSWRDAAARQARTPNLAPGTHLWIAADPTKHWRADG